ncbi:MAG: NAD(P)-dependent glycerol-3-phosphate dehydrogenase, partial [Chloroflexi bacterium]|nr:NAD(P)-dependent glycerol-3-phosphate dehydrogenase [Chloroflexota bacterium]
MPPVAVVGATSWGTTLAVLLARKGVAVTLLARTEDEAAELERDREHRRRLPGIPFPPLLGVTSDPAAALHSAELVILGVPAQTMRANVRALAPWFPPGAVLLSLAKGLEVGSSLRMSQVIAQETPERLHRGIAALSGPNLAREIAQQLPSATVIASADVGAAETAQRLIGTDSLRAYTSQDVTGVELGGALKNIVAMGAGMIDGWGYGNNAKAAYMTRGLAEITRLGVAAGANPLTFLGLAGFGDLLATCISPLSRNRHAGERLAQGRALSEVGQEMAGIVEGAPTTQAARQLAQRLGVEMPITEQMYRVL